jgi:hypothetical protein
MANIGEGGQVVGYKLLHSLPHTGVDGIKKMSTAKNDQSPHSQGFLSRAKNAGPYLFSIAPSITPSAQQ